MEPSTNQLEFTISSVNFANYGYIPEQFAMMKINNGEITPSSDIFPALILNNIPPKTQSLAISVIDPDAPTDFTNANQAGKYIPATMPRQDFIHLLATNIPPQPHITQDDLQICGYNGYNDLYDDKEYTGYNGPCPPWNDEKPHTYIFTVYCVKNVINLKTGFSYLEFTNALTGNTIAQASWHGLYTLNEKL